jgi:hypothetical protein
VAISYERFRLALSALDPAQWRLFERLANVFVATEFPSLRPIAASSGDGGADGLLFFAEDDPSVVLQFSLREDWQAKISSTAKRLKKTYPAARILIYVTNRVIAAKATDLRRRIRNEYGYHLDIRDQEWLLTERNVSTANSTEAEELARSIVDPLLSSADFFRGQANALDNLEAKAAFVYLGLQWEDENREKGLTKLCFEALVRSVLRDTTSDNRLTRGQVRQLVTELLPAHHRHTLNAQVDGALKRLSKRYIRHWQKPDEFCLTWDERVRLAGRLAEMTALDAVLRRELKIALELSTSEAGIELCEQDAISLVDLSRKVLERVLLDRGEAFASAVTHEDADRVRSEDIAVLVTKVLSEQAQTPTIDVSVLTGTIQSLLIQPPEDVRRYLRGLSDTYTLFAFMRETPDVQSAVVKMFSDADIWLDASIVLPLMAEELLGADTRSHTELLAAARECGLRLFITEGVLEELVTHVQRSVAYGHARNTSQGAWGSPPFLFMSHHLSGRSTEDFEQWIENFCGADPESDLLDYLSDEHGIEVESLTQHAEEASVDFRAAVAEVWHEARDAKDRRAALLGLPAMDQNTRHRLVQHDVETYVGVVMRRQARGERRSAFGYKSWWLTLDRAAFRVNAQLKDSLADTKPPASPAISPDFMLNYLAIGPVRKRLSRRSEETLPLMLNMSVLDAVPPDLVELADHLRIELQGLPARIVRRKIKETLEDARRFLGPKAEAGEIGLTEEVKTRLVEAARSR